MSKTIKMWCWETTPQGQENIKHKTSQGLKDGKVDMVSVHIADNNLSLTEDPHPVILNVLKEKLKFKGNIRLSASGQSYNIFKDVLEDGDDLVKITLETNPTIA